MSEANKRQVAGDHYRKEYQHWDYAVVRDLGYLPGQVTKYITRWRTKHPTPDGRLDDASKAVHFLEKLIEVSEHRPPFVSTYAYALNYELGVCETLVLSNLDDWRVSADPSFLDAALVAARDVEAQARREAAEVDPDERACVAAVSALGQAVTQRLAEKRKAGRSGWQTVPRGVLAASARNALNSPDQTGKPSPLTPSRTQLLDAAAYIAMALARLNEEVGAPDASYVNQDR